MWKELALERDVEFREGKKNLEDALRAQRMENERLRAQLGVGAAAVPAAAAEPTAAAEPDDAVPGRGARVRRAVVRSSVAGGHQKKSAFHVTAAVAAAAHGAPRQSHGYAAGAPGCVKGPGGADLEGVEALRVGAVLRDIGLLEAPDVAAHNRAGHSCEPLRGGEEEGGLGPPRSSTREMELKEQSEFS